MGDLYFVGFISGVFVGASMMSALTALLRENRLPDDEDDEDEGEDDDE